MDIKCEVRMERIGMQKPTWRIWKIDIKCEVRMESIGMRNLPGEYGRWI